jgi:RNA polymerase sigma factor (sigma-70 family)
VNSIPADQAVEKLIEQYGRLVFHTIYGMTGDWEESQDLTQDTFHQALKSIDAARAESGAHFREKAWLMGIALNMVRMQRRRRGIFSFVPFSRMSMPSRFGGGGQSAQSAEDALNEQAAPVQPAGYGAMVYDDPGEQVAERDAVRRTMARLPEVLRECLLLSIIGDFSTREIAIMLNVQEAAVRQRLARARKQFQEAYALESGETVGHTDTGTIEQDEGVREKPERKHSERAEIRFECEGTTLQRLAQLP